MSQLNDILVGILERRGITAESLEEYLHPTIDRLAKPEELPGIVEAADIVLDAVTAGKTIVVFGDYDCDGVCATAILSIALKTIGGKPVDFIPDRQTEGYGMSDGSIARMLKEAPSVGLVVTVDNGINAAEQVAALKAKGISVVVTDHHLPGEELPDADATVDPKFAAPPHLSDLCGAGVAFLLANRMVSEAKKRGLYTGGSIGGPLLVLAGLATVTDIMPLTRQNRILVSEALRRFPVCAPVGLRELYNHAARRGSDELTTKDFSFMLGPRINAAGRVAKVMEALELVTTDHRETARELVLMIDRYNLERKSIEQKMLDEAMSKVVPGAAAQVIDLPDGHQGVAGIVAAKVMERIGGKVPVCVRAAGHGSARAPDGINIRDAFVACAETLDRFGGHAAAGGFSVKEGRIDDFRRMLCEYCAAMAGATDAAKACESADGADGVDAWIEPADITLELAEDLKLMEPFGEGNEEPKFGLRGVYLSEVKPLGADGRHLSVVVRGSGLRAIQWNAGDQVAKLRAESARPHDLVFTLGISTYRERHVELHLVAIRKSEER